ncbi:MAG: hypothetical protein LUC47_06025 [Clostridiales bacterium]|nr:hypothetical protein [Clostridiales bacterium]
MKRLLAALCALSMLVLSGCSFNVLESTDELYALPKASEEYTSLEENLQSLLDSGLEYAPPLSGSNTQPVQLQDLDGDGEQEALAFFRESSAMETPLKIYIFTKDDEGLYEVACVIAGDGTDINSVLICQLVGDESTVYELVVAWQVSSALYTLSAYSIEEYTPITLMTQTSYTRYSAVDLDGDEEQELVLMTVRNSDSDMSTAVYYDNVDGVLEPVSTANLSTRLSSIDKTSDGLLADGTPALYVTGAVQDVNSSASYQLTDILLLRDGALCNITLDEDGQNSTDTIRYSLTSNQDINGDGVLEIPIPYLLTNYDNSSSDLFYAVDWRQYAADGSYTVVSITYYNSTDGWYLELPEEWLDCLELARQDTSQSGSNERGILFYYNDGSDDADTPFLGIYKNTGTYRERNATSGDRMILLRSSDAIYSLELFGSAYDQVESAGDLLDRFHLITADWSTD